MICGPGPYTPTAAKKLAALYAYLRIVEHLIPPDPSISGCYLWHNDLHSENIFVDPENPTHITGIIDWQSVQLLPLFDHNPDPGFLEFDGELESLERPKFPDTSGLSKSAKAAAIKEFSDKSLFVISRRLARDKNPTLFHTIDFQTSDPYNVLFLARRIFEIGEAHLNAILVQLGDSWSELPSVTNSRNEIPFPLEFSESPSRRLPRSRRITTLLFVE